MDYNRKKTGGVVYSTDFGRICTTCSEPVDHCTCRSDKGQSPGDGIVRISRETKGRKGSGVSLISGLPLDSGELKQLAKKLKKKCGSGGSVKKGIIEIQGDHRAQLIAELEKEGYKVKRAGG